MDDKIKSEINKKVINILDKISEINYGWVDRYNVCHKNARRDYFIENYRFEGVMKTLNFKMGTCWEMAELAAYYLEEENLPYEMYIVIYNDDTKIARHTFTLTYENNCIDNSESKDNNENGDNQNNKYYLLESSWKLNDKNIIFNSSREVIDLFVSLFPSMYKINDFDINKIEVYQIHRMKEGLSYDEFTSECRKGIKIEI